MAIFGQTSDDAFERVLAPHLDAAYNLARWLTKNEHDASDVVQEACLRALRSLGGFSGEKPRAWFLSIVRNTAFTLLKRRTGDAAAPFDSIAIPASDEHNPERLVLRDIDIALLRTAIDELPGEFREVIVLRELEELSYEDIAQVAGIPIGTVMSRLARARTRLQERLLRDADVRVQTRKRED